MNSKETTSKKNNKKRSHLFRNILIFIIFFGLGLGIGYFVTSRYLETKDIDNEPEEIVEVGPEDITKNEESQELIQNMLSIVGNNTMFYSSEGLSVDTMDNTSKLLLIYNYIISNNLGKSEELASSFVGGITCFNDNFITDIDSTSSVSTNKCTIIRINKNAFKEVSKKLFNDDILDISVTFSPVRSKKCVVDGDTYVCGNINDVSGITGELESKFEIEKVTKDSDGTIVIYEKGYLVDKRSNVNNPNDEYDNYYLHSSDSKEYYYELKSADNLTFKHTFKTNDRQNYYYVSSELEK